MKAFKCPSKILLLLISLWFCTSGCSNIFEETADKTTDAALYEEALKKVDALEFDAALSYFEQLSPSFAANNEVREQWAGALAGKCGLDFIEFFNTISSTGTGATLFQQFMASFVGKELSPEHCVLAEEKINEISTSPLSRTSSQNLFMMILGMAKIGTLLRHEADNAEDSGLGDAAMDAGFDGCLVDNTDTYGNDSFSDADIKQLVTGVGQIFENFAVVGDNIAGGETSNNLTLISTNCSALSPNPCTITDPDNVDNDTVTNMRYLIHTSGTNPTFPIGIGGCNNVDITQCCAL